jgi:hypothetical protein
MGATVRSVQGNIKNSRMQTRVSQGFRNRLSTAQSEAVLIADVSACPGNGPAPAPRARLQMAVQAISWSSSIQAEHLGVNPEPHLQVLPCCCPRSEADTEASGPDSQQNPALLSPPAPLLLLFPHGPSAASCWQSVKRSAAACAACGCCCAGDQRIGWNIL